jgi:hypothetical protein
MVRGILVAVGGLLSVGFKLGTAAGNKCHELRLIHNVIIISDHNMEECSIEVKGEV